MDVIDCTCKKIFLKHSRGAGKSPQPAWALRAAKVAAGSRLKADRNRVTPLQWLVQQPAHIKAAKHFNAIPKPFKGNFTGQINSIVPIYCGHRAKLTHHPLLKRIVGRNCWSFNISLYQFLKQIILLFVFCVKRKK